MKLNGIGMKYIRNGIRISNNTTLKCMCINSTVLLMAKLMVFKQKVKIYNLLMVIKLELCIIVQLLHISTTGFWCDIEEKERQKKKKEKNATTATTATLITTRKGLEIVLISYYDRCASKAHYTIVINGKIQQCILLMVITLEMYEINAHYHNKRASPFLTFSTQIF